MNKTADLAKQARAVLEMNDQGGFTIPAAGLYPHQWLWDSCFIAIGIAHYDVDRAKSELTHLLRGQWRDGMLPHMIFDKGFKYHQDRNIWRSWVNPFAPDDVTTSGITQPPMLAEAVVSIGKKLTLAERRTWYRQMLPALVAYHEWLYRERDPHHEGLVLQLHPWEVGLDNTPPWIGQMHEHSKPWWATGLEKMHIVSLLNVLRRDTKHAPPGQRIGMMDAILYFDTVRRLKRKRYHTDAILSRSLFAIEDVTYNSIFIRANTHLQAIAKTIETPLPDALLGMMKQTETALEALWEPYTGQYYSRNFVTHKLIKEPSIGTLLPLYSGSISKERAHHLVNLLHNQHVFGSSYPVPSVPLNSPWFKPLGYWQGPTWVNTNWLIIDGLKRYGFHDEAAALTEATLELVKQHGFYEYFSPLDGQAAGAANFSWTAALTLDLLDQSKDAK